jgi:predicted nucleic acid-binding protein
MIDSLVVIDASVAVKAVLPNPLQTHCLGLVQTFIEVQPAAPALWAYETTSAIAKSVHFGAITEDEARQALEELDALGVRLFVADADQNLAAFHWT